MYDVKSVKTALEFKNLLNTGYEFIYMSYWVGYPDTTEYTVRKLIT